MEVVFYRSRDHGRPLRVTSDNPDLSSLGNFVKANCREGQAIIYNKTFYNPISGYGDQSQVLEQGHGEVTLDFPAASIRRVDTFQTEGVVLYEHRKYGGRAETVLEHNFDIKFGVSSMLISGGCWELFVHPNFVGPCVTLTRGQYPNPRDIPIGNNKMKSIKSTTSISSLEIVFNPNSNSKK